MKKRLSGVLAAALCLLVASILGACGSRFYALEVGGAKIPQTLYLYYLDRAFSDAQKKIGDNKDVTKSSIDGKNGRDWVKEQAAEYLRAFVAVSTRFADENLTLNAAQKGDISAAVSAQWSVASAHYLALGIDKTVLTKVQENEAKRDSLFLATYDTGGASAVPEEELRQWYQQNYVGFVAINGYFTTEDVAGNSVRLNSEEEQKLRESFAAMAQSVNGGMAIGEAAAANDATKGQELQESVIYRNGSGYPAGFYDEVRSLAQGKAGVIEKGDYIYTVQRVDVMGSDNALYLQNRSAVLRECRGVEFDQQVTAWGKGYTVSQKKLESDWWYSKVEHAR